MSEPRGDEVLDALGTVINVLEGTHEQVRLARERAEQIRGGRAQGASYADLVTATRTPLVVDLVTELLDGLSDAGSRLRRAEARALHAEGLSMDKIAQLLRVSRQRVSYLVRTGSTTAPAVRNRGRIAGLALTDAEIRMLADSLPHIVWVAAPDGSTRYFNRRGSEYAGPVSRRSDDWAWATLVHPDDQARARGSWQHSVETETPFELDFRVKRHDGQYRWHLFRAEAIRGPDGQVTIWLGTATDVHELKEPSET